MKKKILYTLLFFCSLNIKAQILIEVNTICDNEMSTYWDEPINLNLPYWDDDNNLSTPDILDDRYLNRLNWVDGNTPGNGYTTLNMLFTANDAYGDMTNIKPISSTNPWYDYLYYGEEFLPENGWEMLLHNLGYYPNSLDHHPFEELQFTPYIVLYNRYTGIIRVFVTYGKNPIPDGAIDGVKIDLSFALNSSSPNDPNNIGSAVLMHGNSKSVFLDDSTKVIFMSAVAGIPGGENKWYSADFKAAYDPCTCIFPSRLKLAFNWFSTTSFALNGRQITLNENLTDASASQLIEKDFLGSFEYNDGSKKAENGFIIYKSMDKAVDDYIAQLTLYKLKLDSINQINKDLNRKLAIANAFKVLILSGLNPSGAIVSGVSVSAAIAGGATWAINLANNASDLIETDTVRFYTLTKEVKKLIGAQFDFFSALNFKEKPAPTKPSQPVVSYSEMAFKGQLYNDLPIPGPDFMSPGTFKNTEPLNSLNNPLVLSYPIYNDVVGTFAVLEAPRIAISQDINNEFIKDVEYKWNYEQVTPSPAKY